MAATMGLVSWFVNHYETADMLMLILDILSIVVLAAFIVMLNKVGLKKIEELEDL